MSTLMATKFPGNGGDPDMKGVYLFYPDGSNIVNGRFKLSDGKWYPKTIGCRTMAEAKKQLHRIIKELSEVHGLPLPAARPSRSAASGNGGQAKPGEKSIMVQAREQLDQRVKEGRWKSPHIYYSALKYMELGFGKDGRLPPRLVPRPAFINVRDYLTDCEEIANSASEYARRNCQILRLVPGVPPDYIKLLSRLPADKGDGEKGETLGDSQLRTILIKRREEKDQTTQILVEIGLCGGPQIVDSAFIQFPGINFESGLISFRRVKTKEEVRFQASPRLLDLLRQQQKRLRPGAVYVLENQVFTRKQRKKPDCNTEAWKGDVPKEYVDRASVQAGKKMRKFLHGTCGFASTKITNKSFRIHRISFWASVGFKLKTRMRMAGHKDVQRHTDYDRGANSEIKRAGEITWKYYDAIEKGLPFFIPTTPYDLYEVIMDHWQQFPEIVRDAMREELHGLFANLQQTLLAEFASQRVHIDQKITALERQLEKFRVVVLNENVALRQAFHVIHTLLQVILKHLDIATPLAA